MTGSWEAWTSDPSTKVYAAGPDQPVFPDPPTTKSDWYRLGSPRYSVVLTGLAPSPNYPEVPPVAVPIPADVLREFQRFALAYPPPAGPPGGGHDDNCRAWMNRMIATVRFFLPNSGVGHKSTSDGSPASKDVMAIRRGSAIDGYDMLGGAGTGYPDINTAPDWIDISDQFFIDVPAVNHYAALPPSGRPPVPTGPGASSFDLADRLAEGDTRWLPLLKSKRITRPRVMLCRLAPTLADAKARIPLLLLQLAAHGMKAELVLLVNTVEYNLDEASALQWVRDCLALIDATPGGVGSIQGANEPHHPTQQPFLRHPEFQLAVEALVPKRYPFTFGPATHGGRAFAGVSYLTTHGDRSRDPYANAAVSKQLAADLGVDVVEDESIGLGEVAVPGSRVNDPQFGFLLADATRTAGLGATLHIDAGLPCLPDNIPIQLDGLTRFVTRLEQGTIPGPTPIPPGDHPILDVDMFSDEWYRIMVADDMKHAQAIQVTTDWYIKAHGGVTPAQTDIRHGLIWRGSAERGFWRTLRNALDNTWPGGAP